MPTPQRPGYPRVLVVALGRINKADTSNNGLFLRNLFGEWPRASLAQIYSSGDNGDDGFFGAYYRLSVADRFLGNLFYFGKRRGRHHPSPRADVDSRGALKGIRAWSLRVLRSAIVDSGVYELVFRPRVSPAMSEWVRAFDPDVILAQGYNLSFTLLPLKLQLSTRAILAVLPTDDWPTYQYAGLHGEPRFLAWAVRPVLVRAAQSLFTRCQVPFAFGAPMAAEYRRRYGRDFSVINHSDDERRFSSVVKAIDAPRRTYTVVATGTFNVFRAPLIRDLEQACQLLSDSGLVVRAHIYSSSICDQARQILAGAQFVGISPDPGNERLPENLSSADVLWLAEGFDTEFVSAIRLSISSKAHLFMFSGRPIIVYAAPNTGVAAYAAALGWAHVVSERDPQLLAEAIRDLILVPAAGQTLATRAHQVAMESHTHTSNRAIFLKALSRSLDRRNPERQ